ncbi:MAG: hypothetical protein AAB783_01020 [Patescibacteria group bacterium]
MNHSPDNLEQMRNRTMRKVYGIWLVRSMLPLLVAEFVVLATIAVGVQSYMSFENVMSNIVYRTTHHPVGMMWGYVVNAVTNTEFVAKVLLFGALFVGVFIARDAVRVARRLGSNFLRFRRVI